MARDAVARLARRETPNDREAARAAMRALGVTGASEASTEDRLRRKFRARRDELMNQVKSQDEICPIKSQDVRLTPATVFETARTST